jgi:hypothetical protein
LRDPVLLEEHWPGASCIQVPIHPHKGLASGSFARGREPRTRQAAMQVPGDEQPPPFRINMREPTLRVHTIPSAISAGKISVAHALLRAVFALLRTPSWRSHECERGTQDCVRHNPS